MSLSLAFPVVHSSDPKVTLCRIIKTWAAGLRSELIVLLSRVRLRVCVDDTFPGNADISDSRI